MRSRTILLSVVLLFLLLAQLGPFYSASAGNLNQNIVFDFMANAPYAQWKSGSGTLPFPGTSGDFRGYAQTVNNPTLEDGTTATWPGLLMVPQLKYNGYIQATFPEYLVRAGDRFQTIVNCEYRAYNCYVTFVLEYTTASGVTKVLWRWKEQNEARYYAADIDLSSLAGQKVRFVLLMLATGYADGDRALWVGPRIVGSGGIQTQLPSLTPTAVPSITPPIPPPGTCNRASFVGDITVRDGTAFTPGAAFTKGWRIKNIGTCTWTKDYKLTFYSGEQMGAPTSVNMPWVVSPEQTVDVAINAVAPFAYGVHRGYWILRSPTGELFGVGANGTTPIWVEINVTGNPPTTASGYDFIANACAAQWKSGAGNLPCPGTDGDSKGFVLIPSAPKLEDGSVPGLPGLLTMPQFKYNGYIQGIYPTFTVQPGDRFQVQVGCEYGASCYVTFRLDYMTPGGATVVFWTWKEQNEGRTYKADVDLTPLAGKSVRFILETLATGSPNGDRALWAAPRIVRKGNAPTPMPPTATPLPPVSNWLTYTNSAYGFQFMYPPGGQVLNAQDNYAYINLPIVPGTNLVSKYLEVRATNDLGVCNLANSQTVILNGVAFLKQTGRDQGAGQIHDYVYYAAQNGNVCVVLGAILHSGNIGAYPTSTPVFDMAAESAVFEQILSTFTWIASPPVPGTGTYAVFGVPPSMPLLIYSGPGTGNSVVGSFLADSTDVKRTGASQQVGGETWFEVQNPGGGTGWVNAFYLTEYVASNTFCTDLRILSLVQQFKQAVDQSNGALLSSLVSPVHGLDVRLWAYQPANNFTQKATSVIFTSTQQYNWGAGPSGNYDVGTFSAIIQPKLLDTLNNLNMQITCNDSSKSGPVINRWPEYYNGTNYYTLYKPGTPGVDLDFRTWLAGFEYINGQPYLFALMEFIWEP